MGQEFVTTHVDDLLAYLKGKDRVSLQDAATALGVPVSTVQAWADFLVEEKILGIEYKFTKPYIYLNQDQAPVAKAEVIEPAPSIIQVKTEYAAKAKASQISEDKVAALWQQHLREALKRKENYFMEQASRRNAANPRKLWEMYQQDLLARC